MSTQCGNKCPCPGRMLDARQQLSLGMEMDSRQFKRDCLANSFELHCNFCICWNILQCVAQKRIQKHTKGKFRNYCWRNVNR